MATAKKTAKKSAAKKPVAKKSVATRATTKTAAKKTAVRKLIVKVKNAAPSRKATARAHDLRGDISTATAKFLSNGRKDLQALLKVNKHSYEELQSLVKRRTSLLKEAIKDWQTAAKGVNVANPLDSVTKFEALGKEAFKMALENIRQLADLAAKSQAEAFKVVKQSIEDNVSEVSKLLKSK